MHGPFSPHAGRTTALNTQAARTRVRKPSPSCSEPRTFRLRATFALVKQGSDLACFQTAARLYRIPNHHLPMWRNGRRTGLKTHKRLVSKHFHTHQFTRIFTVKIR